jgi:hypothetical protein
LPGAVRSAREADWLDLAARRHETELLRVLRIC